MQRFALAVVAALGLSGCRANEPQPPAARRAEPPPAKATAPAASDQPAPTCDALPFAPDHVLEEASGAVVLASGDVAVVADSGHNGAYVILAPDGALRARGSMPLGDGASDDIEGLARRGDDHYGITSSGWIRRWRLRGTAFALVEGPYSIDPTGGATCARGTSWNCGPNYEGLCLRPAGLDAECDGFAVANANAALVCLRFDDRGRLRVTEAPPLPVGFPGQLSGCTFAPDGQLWISANRFGGNAIGLVDGDPPGPVSLRLVAGSARGFNEAVAAGDRGELFVFSDEDPRRRNHRKYRCSR